MSVRDTDGKVVRGQGAQLSELQEQFIERVEQEGVANAPAIARELNYTSFYRDRRNAGTAFHTALTKLVNEEANSIEAAKGMNISTLIQIREMAIATGDFKLAMEAIKIINDMQGYKAPTKVEQTRVDITATIDLTRKTEDIDYLDAD